MIWLTALPLAVVAAHVRMLPRLQAQERLAVAQGVQVGGVLARDGAERVLRGWQHAAVGSVPAEAGALAPQQLGAVGIGLRVIKKGPARG